MLAVNAVMHALLGSGSPGQRLHAVLPGLLTAAGAAVVESGLAGWSTSRAGRPELLVERIATTAAMFVLIMSGHMCLAVGGIAVIAVRSGSASLGALVMNVDQLHEESLYVRDHARFLDEAARRTIPSGGDPVPAEVKQVVLDQVGYRYSDRETPALDGVSLTPPMGSVTAVVGENGSGKSTLMKVLSGLLLPQTGTVRWGEADIASLDRSEVFDRVALLAQDFQRRPVTAALNIRIGRPAQEAGPGDLRPSVDYAGAGPVVAELPDGLHSLLARMFRGASELSGGEWQKIGLARTHWRSSTADADGVLIVDEPTSALDPEAEIAAFGRIRRLAAPNRAVVRVTHACPASVTPTASTSCTTDDSSNTAATTNSWPPKGATPRCSTRKPPSTPPRAPSPAPGSPTVADPA
ncbi:hypothetical protein BFF78_37255 [Streptomyces fodineus]|uniref:ABC transporter domain-containing protein n=1 Tax=Streptomyces fodineus TaxID=1904616 RepID=A0A1D7YK36_9ACTN|nr:ATP-binding cassette domain-containing protein [Streptomyces fodineus]AOR35957.1 hypothetical protein BFF78_37255 [Streptomyces fodineus]